jgi:hypothetical protein
LAIGDSKVICVFHWLKNVRSAGTRTLEAKKKQILNGFVFHWLKNIRTRPFISTVDLNAGLPVLEILTLV